MIKYLVFFSLIILCACESSQPSNSPTVEVRLEDEQYLLYRHGVPYYIKGAGGNQHLEKLAEYGGNSIRSWSTYKADSVLDQAEQHGLTVTLGLEVGKEFWGEDFNYWNFVAVNRKINELKVIVQKYKNHPALLIWGIGNEVETFGGNQILILNTINRIAKMIHEVDPNHPVMTTLPLGPNYQYLRFLLSDVDIIGINGFKRLPSLFSENRSISGWGKAYIISEWGPSGPWESTDTEWQAPIEKSSTLKALQMENFSKLIENEKKFCLGSYAFYWGDKFEGTHTFFSLFTEDGFETESVQVLRRYWSGITTNNFSPRIDSLLIDSVQHSQNIYLTAGKSYSANLFVPDLGNNKFSYYWELRPEGKSNKIAGDYYKIMQNLIENNNEPNVQFMTPKEEGAYRLFAFVYDDFRNTATQNIPFYVIVK